MADVFISYRNTPERRALVKRLALLLHTYGVKVWWDYGLEAGESYRAQITEELSKAKIVAPLWCVESIRSKWVAMEAELGRDKLVPARLQKVVPPEAFEAIQAADLTGWDGRVDHPRVRAFVHKICERLGKPANAPVDTLEALAELPAVAMLPEFAGEPPANPSPAASPSATAWTTISNSLDIHDYVDFVAHFPGTPEVILAARHRRRLEAWAGVDKADPEAIAAFLRDPAFPALEQVAQQAMQSAAEAKQRAFEQQARAEREARETAEATRRKAEEAARQAEEERLAKPRRAAEAARNGRPVADRAFAVELRNVAGWPKPQMIAIPPGRFLRGAPADEEGSQDYERPQREVSIGYVFALGRVPVTFAEWDAAIAAGAKLPTPEDRGWGRGNRPVIRVSWEDAQAYVGWLNERAGLAGGKDAYRLPSEAEWEYACRAGTTTPFSFGVTISTDQANYDGNQTYGSGKKGVYRKQTTPVGSFPANAFGLQDMHGNVREWCQDVWKDNYTGAPSDGSANTTGGRYYRVLRGGSWSGSPQGLRSAYRDGFTPTIRYIYFGFRLARTLLTS